jgi:hypothetical protein
MPFSATAFALFPSTQLILVLILTPSIQVSDFVNSTIFVVLICVDAFKKSITVSVWTEIFLYLMCFLAPELVTLEC